MIGTISREHREETSDLIANQKTGFEEGIEEEEKQKELSFSLGILEMFWKHLWLPPLIGKLGNVDFFYWREDTRERRIICFIYLLSQLLREINGMTIQKS